MNTIKKLLIICLLLISTSSLAWELNSLGNYQFEPLTENVYVMHGPLGEPSPENQGFMNNPACIISNHGIILIDPGSTYKVGREVLKEIKKISSKPIIAVFNTHIHGDHWLANHAIKEAYPEVKIFGHPKMIKQAKGDKGITWLNLLNRLTEGLSSNTKIVPPNLAVIDQQTIIVDNQKFRIYHNDNAHTDTDIIIEYPAAQVVFLGDNGFNGRFGQFDESASIIGNINALKYAKSLQAKVYVPGHGKSGDFNQAVQPFLNYLMQLSAAVMEGYEADLEDYEIKNKILEQFKTFQNWEGFKTNFGKHINKMYLEIEAL